MPDPANPLRPPRPGTREERRSQVALELMLNVYAVVGGLVILRALLLALGVNGTLWIGRAIYGATGPMTLPFRAVPGADRRLAGDLTVSDLTLLGAVIIFPLFIAILGGRNRIS